MGYTFSSLKAMTYQNCGCLRLTYQGTRSIKLCSSPQCHHFDNHSITCTSIWIAVTQIKVTILTGIAAITGDIGLAEAVTGGKTTGGVRVTETFSIIQRTGRITGTG